MKWTTTQGYYNKCSESSKYYIMKLLGEVRMKDS